MVVPALIKSGAQPEGEGNLLVCIVLALGLMAAPHMRYSCILWSSFYQLLTNPSLF